MFRIDLILRLAIVAELVLIASTWQLWFCTTDFPRVPLLALFLHVPVPVIRSISAALVVSLVAAALSGYQQHRLPNGLVSTAIFFLGCASVCCNQHCLQPWHWLFMISMVYRLTLTPESLLVHLRRLLPCIYIFASVSRLGPEIDQGMSRQIVTALLQMPGLRAAAAESQTVSSLCILVTTAELAAGVLLLVPCLHRIGMTIAAGMHLTLAAAIGPMGLNQQAAVVVWNGFLVAWVFLLFWKRSQYSSRPFCMTGATAFCFVWPTLALFGITDNWTGWQLYSPRPETLRIQIHADAVPELCSSVKPYVEEPAPLQDWCTVRVDHWSLQRAGVPLYPQARFQLAIAVAVTTGISNDDHVRARLLSPHRLKWWDRIVTDYTERPSILRAVENCWLNAVAAAS